MFVVSGFLFFDKKCKMGRNPCCSKVGLNRGAWTAGEDKILTDYIKVHGEGKWRNLPKRAGLKRCGKSCRLRWLNYLRPDIKRGNISQDEEELIIRLHKLLGNRWSLIAGRLPGRTDNEIKNYWNTTLGKQVHNLASNRNNSSGSTQKDKKTGADSKATPLTESTQKNQSNVVRTKAIRCSKVFISPQPNKTLQMEPNRNPGNEPVVGDNNSITNPVELGLHNDLLSFTPEEDFPANFSLGADMMGELRLSDFLSSDFSGLCEFDYRNGELNVLLPSLDLEDWTIGDYVPVQTNVGSGSGNHLESGGEWQS